METYGWIAGAAAVLGALFTIFKRLPALLREARKTVRAWYDLRAEVERGRLRASAPKAPVG
ncbi:hypothetical protein ADK34_34340 [Streptomyces viridochromogenes]|uniref:Uncharacterized protein n=1 Tax=Streptomyces viridochromogenes TaxID=1938 RepID=A0A0L8JCU1_STRVR|nr:hypothetical protein ADK34_34340 [Streptomyces viridochromogenes]